MNMNKFAISCFFVATAFTSSATLASVVGPLGQQWSVTNSGYNYGGAASNVITIGANTLSYSYTSPGWNGVPNQHYDFSTVAASSGPLTLDLTWNSYAAWYQNYTNLSVYTSSGSTLIGGNTWWGNQPISTTLNLTAGETWGFTMDAGNYDSAGYVGGTLTFNSPSAVPVPAAAWLLGSGLLGLAGVARRKAS